MGCELEVPPAEMYDDAHIERIRKITLETLEKEPAANQVLDEMRHKLIAQVQQDKRAAVRVAMAGMMFSWSEKMQNARKELGFIMDISKTVYQLETKEQVLKKMHDRVTTEPLELSSEYGVSLTHAGDDLAVSFSVDTFGLPVSQEIVVSLCEADYVRGWDLVSKKDSSKSQFAVDQGWQKLDIPDDILTKTVYAHLAQKFIASVYSDLKGGSKIDLDYADDLLDADDGAEISVVVNSRMGSISLDSHWRVVRIDKNDEWKIEDISSLHKLAYAIHVLSLGASENGHASTTEGLREVTIEL
jgi:hypothetical protein